MVRAEAPPHLYHRPLALMLGNRHELRRSYKVLLLAFKASLIVLLVSFLVGDWPALGAPRCLKYIIVLALERSCLMAYINVHFLLCTQF